MKRLPLLLSLLFACGPINEPGPANPNGPSGGSGGGTKTAQPAAAGDVSLELDNLPISGIGFEPTALYRPGMPLVEPKRKVTLAQQRSIVSNARDPVLKQAQAAVLATMLYQEAKTAPKEKEKELWTEARQALRDAATAAGKNIDEVTLRLLGSYELLFDDFAAAEKAWEQLIATDPKDKETPYHKAWWAYSLLKQWKNPEALAVVASEPLSDTQPELAYVTAWAKWRAGDGAAAWEAILTAAKGWGQNAGKEVIERDVLLIAGRTKVTFAQAMPRMFDVFGAKQPAQQYDILTKLGTESYQFAGRWTDAIAAIEEALKVIGAQVPPIDRAYLRYRQADFTVRLDTPDVAAKYAKQAIDGLSQCPKCTPKEKQDLVSAVAVMARLFHIMYATANDIRYYQPANDLYVLTTPLIADAQRRAQINDDAQKLQSTLKNTKVGTGTHGKDAVGVLIERHSQEVKACYEAVLIGNPKVAGTLIVNLESDQTGAIKGVATEPKAGQAELPAVAGCVTEAARKWNLPKRGMAGTTRVKATFTLAKK
ncbi:MAG TPA: AgmX/PglI C-terminal domain-containing protein [Kofleriaceae bacterium]|nr:AgmX/PglI C-terminal domain-containing protein [Kofleriaceae bacterium]